MSDPKTFAQRIVDQNTSTTPRNPTARQEQAINEALDHIHQVISNVIDAGEGLENLSPQKAVSTLKALLNNPSKFDPKVVMGGYNTRLRNAGVDPDKLLKDTINQVHSVNDLTLKDSLTQAIESQKKLEIQNVRDRAVQIPTIG